jgi:hypothetical protein
MRPFFFGLVVVVSSVTFSSFTSVQKCYNYSVIGETSNAWLITTEPMPCNAGDEKPCDISIDPQYVNKNMEVLKKDLAEHGKILSRRGEF